MSDSQAVNEFNVDDRVRKYLAKCDPAVSGQHGHDATFKVAIALVWGFALRRDAALAHLRAYNKKCQPPWSEGELETRSIRQSAPQIASGRRTNSTPSPPVTSFATGNEPLDSMSKYILRTRIARVTENFVFLENLETGEEGVLLHIQVRLDREDAPPSEMARIYHEDFNIMCTCHVWNDVTQKLEPDGAPPIKNGLTFAWGSTPDD